MNNNIVDVYVTDKEIKMDMQPIKKEDGIHIQTVNRYDLAYAKDGQLFEIEFDRSINLNKIDKYGQPLWLDVWKLKRLVEEQGE